MRSSGARVVTLEILQSSLIIHRDIPTNIGDLKYPKSLQARPAHDPGQLLESDCCCQSLPLPSPRNGLHIKLLEGYSSAGAAPLPLCCPFREILKFYGTRSADSGRPAGRIVIMSLLVRMAAQTRALPSEIHSGHHSGGSRRNWMFSSCPFMQKVHTVRRMRLYPVKKRSSPNYEPGTTFEVKISYISHIIRCKQVTSAIPLKRSYIDTSPANLKSRFHVT